MSKRLLSDKISIITGGGSGFGKAIAEIFAKEGSTVIINDIDLKKACLATDEINNLVKDSKKNNVIAIKADVTSTHEVNNMIEEVIKEYKKIDILVNNAGLLFTTRFNSISEEEWDKVINVKCRENCKYFRRSSLYSFKIWIIGIYSSYC